MHDPPLHVHSASIEFSLVRTTTTPDGHNLIRRLQSQYLLILLLPTNNKKLIVTQLHTHSSKFTAFTN